MPRNANYKKNKDILKAHKTSFENELLVNKSTKCGCFYCGKIFEASEVIEWAPPANPPHGYEIPPETCFYPYCHPRNDCVGNGISCSAPGR